MRVVLDANVPASGFVGHPDRPPAAILSRWADRTIVLVTSAAIRAEVERTIGKSYFVQRSTSDQRAIFLSAIDERAEFVVPVIRIEGVATHPEDDRVLETAVSAGVAYLVTGDRGLQRLGEYAGIPILDPRAFRDILDGLPPE